MRGHPLKLAMVLLAVASMLVPALATPAGADGNNTCKFDNFPVAPGASSELAIGCFLTTATAGAGSKYFIEDFPQAHWHTGAGRKVTNFSLVAASGTVITSANAHFGPSDINASIAGFGIPSNDYIVAVGTSGANTTATLAIGATVATIPAGKVLIVDNSDARTLTDASFGPGGGTNGSGVTLISTKAHFCKPLLNNCGTKTDIGKTVQGTQVSHLATITGVTDATHATISPAAIACPAGVLVVDCTQVSLNLAAPATSNRQVKDLTFVSPNKVCSLTAGFAAGDVNLPIASTGAPSKFPAGEYISAVGAVGCPLGATEATLHLNWVVAGANAVAVIGQPSASAPLNGSAMMQLNSELSVSPTEAPGLPACSSGILVGSNLIGKWLNPGSFDPTALGGTNPLVGPVIGQVDVVTGGTNQNLAGYVELIKAGTAGESDTSAHYDIVFPQLLTGIAVCPAPSTAGVATTFRFNGSSLDSQIPGSSGDVRDLSDFATGAHAGTAYEHIKDSTSFVLLNTNGSCTINYPATNGFPCGGN